MIFLFFYIQFLNEAIGSSDVIVFAVSGEDDPNQTEFESLSNELGIAIQGPLPYANGLLFILRVLTDKNYDFLENMADGMDEQPNNYIMPEGWDSTLPDYRIFKFALMQQEAQHLLIASHKDQLMIEMRSEDSNILMTPTENSKFYTPYELRTIMYEVPIQPI